MSKYVHRLPNQDVSSSQLYIQWLRQYPVNNFSEPMTKYWYAKMKRPLTIVHCAWVKQQCQLASKTPFNRRSKHSCWIFSETWSHSHYIISIFSFILHIDTFEVVCIDICNVFFSLRWYFGKIKRVEAEKKLLSPENEHGAYLIRDSESRRNDYSLSGNV